MARATVALNNLEQGFKVQGIRVGLVVQIVVGEAKGLVHRRGEESVAHHEQAQHLHTVIGHLGHSFFIEKGTVSREFYSKAKN